MTQHQTSTADALLQLGISPNVMDRNLEPANLVDALALVGDSIRMGFKWLGNADANTPMGAIEAHGQAIKEAGEEIASALRDLAEAIRWTKE